MRLSLHKGGCIPDYRGDKGIHTCVYAFLPHQGSLSAGNVVEPAYLLNEKPLVVDGSLPMESLVRIDTNHIISETVKPLECEERGFILRLYEAEGSGDRVTLEFGFPVKALYETNMLEEVEKEDEAAQQMRLNFRPFEIKTAKVNF